MHTVLRYVFWWLIPIGLFYYFLAMLLRPEHQHVLASLYHAHPHWFADVGVAARYGGAMGAEPDYFALYQVQYSIYVALIGSISLLFGVHAFLFLSDRVPSSNLTDLEHSALIRHTRESMPYDPQKWKMIGCMGAVILMDCFVQYFIFAKAGLHDTPQQYKERMMSLSAGFILHLFSVMFLLLIAMFFVRPKR